jgi:hypothetical protein
MTHTQPPERDPAPGYLRRVVLALDRLANTLLGGDDRYTVSERLRDSQGWIARNIFRHFAHDEEERRPRPPGGAQG